MATSPRKPKVRPYPKDYLTKPTNGHFTIQFRVPDHLKGIPPFGDKKTYKKSTGTSNRREALAVRDAFFAEIDFYQRDYAADRAAARRTPTERYYDALNSVSGSVDELLALRETLTEYATDEDSSASTRAKYQADLDGVDRKIEAMTTSAYEMANRPHRYEVGLGEMVQAQYAEMTMRGLPKKTRDKIVTAYKRYKEFAGADPRLSDITRPRVRLFIKSLRDRKQSLSTTGNDLTYLGQAFEFARDNGFVSDIHANPFRDHKLVGFPEPETRVCFSTDEIKLMLSRAEGKSDLMAMIYLGHYTGMRLSEAFATTLVKDETGWLWSVAKGKTPAATRKIPVHDKLREALIELDLWPQEDASIAWASSSGNALGKKFQHFKDRLFVGRQGLTYHSFRHGFVTQLGREGYHDLEYGYLTGHSTSGAATEGARTYLHRGLLPRHWEMINSLTIIPLPSELVTPQPS